MEVYHYIFGFTIFLFGIALSQSDKPSGLSQGTVLEPQNNYYIILITSMDEQSQI
jgi:hypothetical protein